MSLSFFDGKVIVALKNFFSLLLLKKFDKNTEENRFDRFVRSECSYHIYTFFLVQSVPKLYVEVTQ
jgi:hypothetical protein